MDNNLALSAVELVLRSELNCNGAIGVGADCNTTKSMQVIPGSAGHSHQETLVVIPD